MTGELARLGIACGRSSTLQARYFGQESPLDFSTNYPRCCTGSDRAPCLGDSQQALIQVHVQAVENAGQGVEIGLLVTNRVHGCQYNAPMPRIIYSLKFNLGRTPNGEIVELIVPLDPHGQSPHCRAVRPKRRVIDLRIGDRISHGGRSYRIEGIEAYRENRISEERLRENPPTEGYVVRRS